MGVRSRSTTSHPSRGKILNNHSRCFESILFSSTRQITVIAYQFNKCVMMVYELAVRDEHVFVMMRRIINVTCSPAICACASLLSSSSFRLDMEHDLPRRIWSFKNNLLAGISSVDSCGVLVRRSPFRNSKQWVLDVWILKNSD
jgi:hypothetical protein